MKQKYTKTALQKEMRRVYRELGFVPTIKKWDNTSKINSSTLVRRWGSWAAAWTSIGLSRKKQSTRKYKQKIIQDFIQAYKQNPDITNNNEILRLSGHTRTTVYKYFTSMDGLINAAKVDGRKRITNEDLVEEFRRVYSLVDRAVTKKDIKQHSKYSLFLYQKRCGGLEPLNKMLGADTSTTNTNDKDLFDNILHLKQVLGRVPSTGDINRLGKYSESTYRRRFGCYSAALEKLNLKPRTNSKKQQDCFVCGITSKSLPQHIKKKHPDEYNQQNEYIVGLFKNGHSAEDIANMADVIYNGKTSINRVISQSLSKNEIAQYRKAKIKNTLQEKYTSGELDWVKNINRTKNIQDDVRLNISLGLRQAYKSGNKKPWNAGLDKENNDTIKKYANNISKTIKMLYETGQLERSNSGSLKRGRLGAGFGALDRRKIKERAGYKCQACGVTQEEIEGAGQFLECDHVLPIYKGGVDDWKTNGQALCPGCHKQKTSGVFWVSNYTETMLTPINCNLNEIIVYDNQPLTSSYVSSLNHEQRYEVALGLLGFFMDYDFRQSGYSKNILQGEWKSLYNGKFKYKDTETHKIISNKNTAGNKICRHFCPSIMNMKQAGRMSVSDVLSDPEMLFKTILNRLGLLGQDKAFTITPATIVRGAKNSFNAFHGSQFKPQTARHIYNYWVKDGDTVYDSSCGFGGRLLGFGSLKGSGKYIGVEPNTEVYKSLRQMCVEFDINAEIHNKCSEDFVPSEPVDFAFTSPPYFDHEIYTDEKTQSINKFPDYDDWLEGYWRQTVKNIKSSLATNGIFGLNAGGQSNEKMKRIHKDMNSIVLQEGFVLKEQWFMVTNSFNGDKYEPIDFYKLGENDDD